MIDFGEIADEDLFGLQQASIDAELERRGYVYGWHKPETCVGTIYVFVNPAFLNLVKIGYADDVAKRLKQLNRNSGLPDPFHCYATYGVKKRLEDRTLHSLIDMLDPDLRHSDNREFYEMSKEDAYRILSAIAQINGNEDRLKINPLDDPYFEDDVSQTISSGDREKKQKAARFTFDEVDIPVGSKLVFTEKSDITVKTVDGKSTVEMADGARCKLSSAVRIIKEGLGTGNASGAYQGAKFFLYEGELLSDRRARMGSLISDQA